MINITLCDNLAEIDATAWDSLFGQDLPFCRHAFLSALEQGGSVGKNTGWLPQHLLLYRGERLVAAMPMYLKLHSYGEYLFDWAIAEAYQQHQLPYYPKLLCAIPFTPAEGQRLGVAPDEEPIEVFKLFYQAILQRQQILGCSNFQCLYADPPLQQIMRSNGMLERIDVQFQWYNHNFTNFADFLATLPSRKRKQINKERLVVKRQGVEVKTFSGDNLPTDFWYQFVHFYQATYQKRSGHDGYLTPQTFMLWAEYMAAEIVIFAAFVAGELVAASLCFQSANCLYGRYWGCNAEFDKLHFECCYYAGIEYCIAKGLKRFDAGAQGEHKLKRGFLPVVRHGYYNFSPSPLVNAITDYCLRERQALLDYYQLTE
ncbi:GNAT family N-acetyltransferase [Arsukibacterium sp.]|uniref:GNAT family N-acetyltransferase n=1 Tax=Arsukibacterium sp. TaxID=1977258 RepID=UPI001BD587D8|nr:GNAT family N-acetyltransferase [Arsukibacterium sp.]